MSDPPARQSPVSGAAKAVLDREARLAIALRANLKRRKQSGRTGAPEPLPPDPGEE